MNLVINVHHPDLTKEEREHRVEQIKKEVIKFHREVIKENEKSIYSN